jgi:hypothetical protein
MVGSVAEPEGANLVWTDLGSAGLDKGIGMGQPRNDAALSSRRPSLRHGHRMAGGVKTMMRLTDLVLGLR